MLTYFPIPPQARHLCGVAYTLSTAAPVRLRLAALMPQIQVVLSGQGRQTAGDTPALHDMPAVTLVGATHSAGEVALAAGSRVVGVGLLPEGLRRATGIPADRIADRMIEAGGVWGDGPAARLAERLGEARDGQGAARILFDFVRAAADRAACPMDPRILGIEQWLGQAGSSDIDALAARLDLSRRQTARLAAQSHGASPKILEMKYRALRLAAAIALGRQAPNFADAAASDGYYDQSHRIRDFRRFVGWTPAQFERDHAMFARIMLAGRWDAGARSPTTLWS